MVRIGTALSILFVCGLTLAGLQGNENGVARHFAQSHNLLLVHCHPLRSQLVKYQQLHEI